VTKELDNKNIFMERENKSGLINLMKQIAVCKKRRASGNEDWEKEGNCSENIFNHYTYRVIGSFLGTGRCTNCSANSAR
jgi:hypothetical protein